MCNKNFFKKNRNNISSTSFEVLIEALDITYMPFLAFLHIDLSDNNLGKNETNALEKIANLNEITRLTINLNTLISSFFLF